MSFQRPHPLFILTNLKRFLWLLIVPLGRGFISAVRGRSLVAYFEGFAFDIAVLGLMLLFSIADWYRFTYRATGEGIAFSRGVFDHRRAFIPVAATYTVEQPLSYRLVGAARLWADTPAGHYRKNDFYVIAHSRVALDLIGRPTDRGHRPSSTEVAVMSFLASNSLAGILILMTAVRGVGQILGNEFRQVIFERFQQLSTVLAFGIPPAAVAIAYLLLGGWLLAFFYNFLRFWGFRADRQGEDLVIRTGLFSPQTQRIAAPSVGYLDVRRNLPCVLLRLFTVLVMAPGSSGKPSVIVPAAGETATGQLVERLLPRLRPDTPQLRPMPNSWIRYYSEPVTHMLYILLPGVLLSLIFPDWQSVVIYLTAMAELVPIWGLAIRVADLHSAGAARGPDRLTIRYSSYFYLHTAVVSLDSVVSIKIRQSPLQRFYGTCDVQVTSCVEHRFTTHCLRNYRHSDILAFFST